MARATKKPRFKTERFWLERPEESGSWAHAYPGESYEGGGLHLQLGDCGRSIAWYIPCNKRGLKKIAKIKALVDRIHAHVVENAKEE